MVRCHCTKGDAGHEAMECVCGGPAAVQLDDGWMGTDLSQWEHRGGRPFSAYRQHDVAGSHERDIPFHHRDDSHGGYCHVHAQCYEYSGRNFGYGRCIPCCRLDCECQWATGYSRIVNGTSRQPRWVWRTRGISRRAGWGPCTDGPRDVPLCRPGPWTKKESKEIKKKKRYKRE